MCVAHACIIGNVDVCACVRACMLVSSRRRDSKLTEKTTFRGKYNDYTSNERAEMLRKMVQRKKVAIFKEIWVTQYVVELLVSRQERDTGYQERDRFKQFYKTTSQRHSSW